MGYLESLFLLMSGGFLLGAFFFLLLMPFSVGRELSSRLSIYVFPRMFRAKYYKPERLWVKRGFLICSVGLFATLAIIAFFYLGASESQLDFSGDRGRPPF